AAPDGNGNRSPGPVQGGKRGLWRPGLRRFRSAGNGPLLIHPAIVPVADRKYHGPVGTARYTGRACARCRDAAVAAVAHQFRVAGRPDENADDPVFLDGTEAA